MMNIQAKHLITLLFASALFACEGENGSGSGSTESEWDQPQAWAESPLCGLSYVPTEVGKVGFQDLAVRNDGNTTLKISAVSFLDDTDGVFSAEVGKDNADYKDSALLRVSFRPTAAGWARARLLIESNAQNYPRLIIPVLALAYPAGGDPDTYDPGDKPTREDDTTELCPTNQARISAVESVCGLTERPIEVNTSSTVDVQLKNEGTAELELASVAVTGSDRGYLEAVVQASKAAPDGFATIRLTYAPKAAGWDGAQLVIRSNAENSPLTIPLLALAYPEGGDPSSYDPDERPEVGGQSVCE